MLHTDIERAVARAVPLPKTLPAAARKKVCAAIELHLDAVAELTAFLDECDGDADFEPSIGATEPKDWTGDKNRYCGRTDLPALDLEDSCEGEAEQCEDEGAEEGY